MQKLRLKTTILGKFREKIEISGMHNQISFVQKLQLPAPTTFLTRNATHCLLSYRVFIQCITNMEISFL